jgi:hypothetical protein
MPPRLAEAEELRTSALAPLPLALVQRILVLLPVDSRARASCVARAWRDALTDPALWTRLDLSGSSGVSDALERGALLRGAAGRARGQLAHLDVVGPHVFSLRDLLAVVAANGDALRELRVVYLRTEADREPWAQPAPTSLEAFLRAAPRLQLLDAEVTCRWADAVPLLRGEALFAPLRLRALEVDFSDGAGTPRGGAERAAAFAAALADAALHPALLELSISHLDTQRPAVLGALVDAALARGLRTLHCRECTPPAPEPLARLLAAGALAELRWRFTDDAAAPLLDAAGAALVADALRASRTLTSLLLEASHVCRDMRAAEALLGALVGHPTLRRLELFREHDHDDEDALALGTALAALVAADAPALQELQCNPTLLGDAGLAPLVAALPRNTHLRTLDFALNNMSEAFARERLLPAVRANTSLQLLRCRGIDRVAPAAEEAQALVAARQRRA